MYWPDIAYLEEFYKTQPGIMARRQIDIEILKRWRDIKNEQIVGLGFTCYFLQHYLNKNNVATIMPVRGGVTHWPKNSINKTCIAQEVELPIADNCVDRMLVIHTMEYCHSQDELLKEIWRILKPEGVVLFIVPNRAGIWAHIENTPFGHGHPYSKNQLENLLNENMFTVTEHKTILFTPPFNKRILLLGSGFWKLTGNLLLKTCGGLLVIEAKKRIYSLTGKIKLQDEKIRKPIMPPAPAINRNHHCRTKA